MTRIFLILTLGFLYFSANAQWQTVTPGTTSNAILQSVFFTTPSTGFAVGSQDNQGLILKTADSGTTWTSYPTTTYGSFSKVYFTSLSTGYVSGIDDNNNGIVLKTTDTGKLWTPLPVPSTSFAFYNIHFTDSLIGFVSDVHGTIYGTKDGGSTWAGVAGSSWGLNSTNSLVFVDAQTGFAFGNDIYGGIQKTSNSGTSWVTQTHPTTHTLRAAHFIDTIKGWAVGDSGTILSTIDGGTSWNQQVSGTTEDLQGIFFTNQDIGITVGKSGIILKTKNGGTTWSTQSSNTTETLYAIHLVDSNIGYIVGSKTLLGTLNGGGYPLSTRNYIGLNSDFIHIYPNPSKGIYRIATNDQNGSYKIAIRSSMGQTVMKKEGIITDGFIEFSLEDKPCDIYFVHLEIGNINVTRKILKD